jgi:hypothetical protein
MLMRSAIFWDIMRRRVVIEVNNNYMTPRNILEERRSQNCYNFRKNYFTKCLKQKCCNVFMLILQPHVCAGSCGTQVKKRRKARANEETVEK